MEKAKIQRNEDVWKRKIKLNYCGLRKFIYTVCMHGRGSLLDHVN